MWLNQQKMLGLIFRNKGKIIKAYYKSNCLNTTQMIGMCQGVYFFHLGYISLPPPFFPILAFISPTHINTRITEAQLSKII